VYSYIIQCVLCAYDRCEFERNVPFHLRCRASLKAMVSVYSSDADVEADSPPPSRSDMTLSTASPHAQAFLAVFERSSVSLRRGVLYDC
jgi:hypothetical protein